jgi:hypothetical protein
MNKLEIALPPDSVNGLERRLVHTELRINGMLEMSQRAKVDYYKGDIPIEEVIDNDPSLTPSQKDQRKSMYRGVTYGSSTDNTMVDPKTGEEIIPGPSGYPDVPMVTELVFWQSLPSVYFTAANLQTIYPNHSWLDGKLLSDLVYNAIQVSMIKMAEREKV